MKKKTLLHDIREDDYRSRHPGTADLDFRIRKLSDRGKTAVQIALEIPCSESTVYRALRRVQDFISAQNYDRFLLDLRKAIDQNPPNFGDGNARSVLEMLHDAYSEFNRCESTDTKAGFSELYMALDGLPLTTVDSVIDEVCALCYYHERDGFTEGLKLGVRLGNELAA